LKTGANRLESGAKKANHSRVSVCLFVYLLPRLVLGDRSVRVTWTRSLLLAHSHAKRLRRF